MVTIERLKELLSYDKGTGVFTWIACHKHKTNLLGKVAGCLDSGGYVVIKIDGKLYKAHRLAVLYVKGRNFIGKVDHINRTRNDNRYTNLRVTTAAGNCNNKSLMRNNTSGHPGVYWQKKAAKWRAFIWVGGKEKHLGVFTNFDEACRIRDAEAAKHYTVLPPDSASICAKLSL